MSDAVQVALIVALAPIGATVITFLLNRTDMKKQDVVLKEQAKVIEKVHTATNSNYSALSDRLDEALEAVKQQAEATQEQARIVTELKDEIARINYEGIITPQPGKRRGDVTLKDGVVETRTEREHMTGQSHADNLQEQHTKKRRKP